MKIIRKGVFETNSSSSHSISISRNSQIGNVLDLPTNDDNEVVVSLDEFGWGYEELRTQESKFSYLLTMVVMTEIRGKKIPQHISPMDYFKNTEGFKSLEEFVQSYGYSGISINDITIEWKSWSSGGRYLDISGYIDHQSYEDYDSLKDFINDYNTTIQDILLNDSNYIKIDNDNH